MADLPPVPAGVGEVAAAWWADLHETFEIEPHQVPLATEACRLIDQLDQLDAAVRRDGAMLEKKVHPALVEARQGRIVLTRLLASLRLPDEDGSTQQHRGGARTPYAVGS